MCDYTSINKKTLTYSNVDYLDEAVNKLISSEQYKIALEYVDDAIEKNNNSYIVDKNLQEKFNFTKQNLIKLINTNDNKKK